MNVPLVSPYSTCPASTCWNEGHEWEWTAFWPNETDLVPPLMRCSVCHALAEYPPDTTPPEPPFITIDIATMWKPA